MHPVNYSHNTSSGLQVKVIASSHCIQVEDQQIELIYMFGANSLHVYIEDKLVLSTQIRVNQTMINYANLIEVAIQYFERERKMKIKREKEENQMQKEEERPGEKKNLAAYILNDLTEIIHEEIPPHKENPDH